MKTTFDMDGIEHRAGDPDCCMGSEMCNAVINDVSFGKNIGAYDRCEGKLHYQPVYGGYYYQCEKCGRTK